MFGNGHKRELRELHEELARLKTDFNALARDVLDINESLNRWMRRDRTRAAREGAEPPAQMELPAPPPGLRGVRLRRWMRARVPDAELEQLTDGGENGVHS